MKHRIFTLTETAQIYGLSWDHAIITGEIETVQEFETYEEAVQAYENGGYNDELYGVE